MLKKNFYREMIIKHKNYKNKEFKKEIIHFYCSYLEVYMFTLNKHYRKSLKVTYLINLSNKKFIQLKYITNLYFMSKNSDKYSGLILFLININEFIFFTDHILFKGW